MNKPLKFISSKDALTESINAAANELYLQIKKVDVDALPMDAFCRDYFKQCHSERLIFSLSCSAKIIYDSVSLRSKPLNELTFVDYGAGLGTLFMLAAKLPFKEVIYNDHLQEWCSSAQVICGALQIPIRHFIKGDIKAVIETCRELKITPGIIASRNVIEHIYDLHEFYGLIKSALPSCLVYSSTTANFQNSVMRLKHIFYHRKVEKKWHREQRKTLILNLYPSIEDQKLNEAVEISREKQWTILPIL